MLNKIAKSVALCLLGVMPALSLAQAGGATGMVARELREALPATIKSSGTLRVGSQQTFPPVEYREDGSNEVQGLSVDLLREIASRLGLKVQYVHAEYASLIPGIQAGRFDVASGGLSDTEEREEKLDFVNYFNSGVGMLALAAEKSSVNTIDDLCGKGVATLLGSRVIVNAVNAASERCSARGQQKIRIEQLPAAPDARMQLDLGRVHVYLGDIPALVYLASKFPGKYRIAGGNYTFTSYILSWGTDKSNPALRDAIFAAAKSMQADGSYQKIMGKWNSSGFALPEITINLPASKRNK
ncbi:periplasmic component of amino acid ABC-type transporter/signal transduction system [Herbaspirillum sp. YR522]|nr:periplasmic component of amino acid ABC-type transporter/signal transduction system [Herbaspirillum sp. YR522]